jgi:hypothetical protein
MIIYNKMQSASSSSSIESKQEIRRKRKEDKKNKKSCSFEFIRDATEYNLHIDISPSEAIILDKLVNEEILSSDEQVIYNNYLSRTNINTIIKSDFDDFLQDVKNIRTRESESSIILDDDEL